MGLVDTKWPLTPRDSRQPAWEKAKDKEWEMRRMAVYAAMIERLDTGIGILLSVMGIVLLVAGLAQWLQVSAAIGAFLVGVAISGPIAEQPRRLIGPLQDLFAAMFFLLLRPGDRLRNLQSVLAVAVALAAVTTLTKTLTGYWASRKRGIERRMRLRAGLTLVAHGEFSIVIAGLAAAVEPQLASLSAAYVLLMVALGPIWLGLSASCRSYSAEIVSLLWISTGNDGKRMRTQHCWR